MGSQVWQGHYHGYSFKGREQDHQDDKQRKPGVLQPPDAATVTFRTGQVAPLQNGHWLLRKPERGRTWTDPEEAIAWMRAQYEETPPFLRENGDVSGVPLEVRAEHSLDALAHGSDAVWTYMPSTERRVSIDVICCPHRFITVPCPLPPP